MEKETEEAGEENHTEKRQALRENTNTAAKDGRSTRKDTN